MMMIFLPLTIFSILQPVLSHSALWHPSMFGFNVTDKDFPYDNRPVVPIKNMPFDKWWFHNHLSFPPLPNTFFPLEAGKPATAEIACNKGATSFFASSEGGDIRDPNKPNDPCPHSPTQVYHTNGFDDLKGCALAIAYESDANKVQPEDFTIFSVNQTCVWTRFTDFQVPRRMPPCPEGGCTCAFFWIHSEKSGGEENYMNGFKCNVTSSTSNVPLAKPKVPRRCGADPDNGRMTSTAGNCTYGAKNPFYWFNNERNNMFEGTYSPPFYTDLYNFLDGAQDDIFEDSYDSLPDPAPNARLPVLADLTRKVSGVKNVTAASLLVNNSTVIEAAAVQGSVCRPLKKSLTRRSLEEENTAPFGLKRIYTMLRSHRRLNTEKRAQLWSIF